METAAGSRRSFRDPAGRLFIVNDRVFRVVEQSHIQGVRRFIDSPFFHRRCAAGEFPTTQIVEELPEDLKIVIGERFPECVLEHHRMPFPVYSHEWLPSMLYDAGRLTLDLAEEALVDGWMLKDATPWNVLYSDGRPIFCDVLSFEPRRSSRIWHAYAQFQRTFVLPLYAHDRHAWPVHSIFLDRRDGIDPAELAPVVRNWRRWAPFEFQTIVLPTLLSRRINVRLGKLAAEVSADAATPNRQLADFTLRRSLRRLRKQLDAVRPRGRTASQWSNYENELHHYSDEDRESKSKFVRAALSRTGAGNVLDIGANAGEYSLIAASQGAAVVAADFDPAALERLYARSKAGHLRITPVVLNIARPTPAVGWANREIDSFLVRARGQFRIVMMLALLHHLLVTERIPLQFIINLLFDLDAPFLMIEWVSPNDLRFRELSRTHGDLYRNLSDGVFEQEMATHFRVIERLPLTGGTRILYLFERC